MGKNSLVDSVFLYSIKMILTSPLGENNKVKKQLRWLELYLLSVLLESGPAPLEIKQDKHICKESRENSPKKERRFYLYC